LSYSGPFIDWFPPWYSLIRKILSGEIFERMDVLVERLSQLEQEQEMEAREFQLVVLQV
jgi:hypothetical protein